MFKRKELAEIPNVKPIAAETKKQRAKEEKQRSKQLRRSAKQSEMNAAQSARSIKKCRAPEKAADCLQYERMYESGICEVEPGLFSMTMAFTDVNFQLARQEEQKSLFTQYSEFLNYFDPDTHLQISLVTRRVDEAEFRRDTFLPLRGDNRDRYSEEMNRVISEKALQGQNGLIKTSPVVWTLNQTRYLIQECPMMSVPVTHPESCMILLEVIRKLSPAQTRHAPAAPAPIMICCAASTRTVTIKLLHTGLWIQ